MEGLPAMMAAPLFRGLDGEELSRLLERSGARRREYERGEQLLRRGERTECLGLVLSGTVHIVREDFWGNRSIVGLAEEGEVFAETYALSGEPLEVSVLAAKEVTALFLRVSGIEDSRLTANLLALLAEKNLQLSQKIRHMAQRTIRGKLLSYLSAQTLRAGGPDFQIPLDRQQLADYLSVDRSAMSAALGKLRDEGVLRFRKNQFHLLQIPEREGEDDIW